MKYWKVRDHCLIYRKIQSRSTQFCNLKFNVPNEIPVVFHNGSNYGYYYIIKELANQFEGKFECLGQNTEKYNIFCSKRKRKCKLMKMVMKVL